MGEKVVVHFRDGRLLKGFASHPAGNVSSLDVLPLDQRDHPVTVRLESVKAIFFVKDFAGDAGYSESKAFGDDEPIGPDAWRFTWRTARYCQASSRITSPIPRASF
jgi:hypothetical protein